MWQMDVTIPGEELSEMDAIGVEVFNEKSFFFNMFVARETENSKTSGEEKDPVARSEDESDTGSSGDERAGNAAQPSGQQLGVGTSDECVGSIELSLPSLLERAVNGDVATDRWYCLNGVSNGEIRIRTLVSGSDDHDKGEKETTTKNDEAIRRDFYGFELKDDAAKEWRQLESYYECREKRREAKWDAAFATDFFECSGSREDEHFDRVAAMARDGIPRSWRTRVYLSMSGGLALREAEAEDYYRHLVERIDSTESSAFRQIELDIDRTFGHSGTKICTHSGQASLRRILRAYSLRNSELGYCQASFVCI